MPDPLPIKDVSARSWALAEPNVPPKPEDASGELDLFQNASSHSEENYARWRAETAAEKAPARQARDLLNLPADASESGYSAWKSELAAARLAFERLWGVPIGKVVRLQLNGELREREGTLRLAKERNDPLHARDLRLTLNGHSFTAKQIESLTRV